MFQRRPAPWLYALVAFCLAGCTTAPNNPFSILGARETLTDDAKDIREVARGEVLGLPRELKKTVQKPYVVEPGDVLLVQPADFDSPVRIPADQPILPDGTIHLGRYGQIIVAGKTVAEIEGLVREVVQAQEKNPGPIVVRVVTRLSKVYYVLGEVNAPGAFPLQGRETVLDGILAAGGLNARASKSNIILSRPSGPLDCRTVLPISYKNIVQLGDTTTNYQLAPGDRIYVASRGCLEGMKNRKHGLDCDGIPQNACPLPHGGPPHGGPHDVPPPGASAPLPFEPVGKSASR